MFQLFQHIRGHSLLSTVAQQSPVAVSRFCGSLAVGFFLSKVEVACIMFRAMYCFFTGQILAATAPVSQTYWAQTFVSVLIMPWGVDLSFPCGTIIRYTQGRASEIETYRYSWYFAIGLDSLGTAIALYFLWISVRGKTVS
jgi:hypothetical protein